MFEIQNREDWLEKVEKELKGRLEVQELDFEIDGLRLSPFNHISELNSREPIYREHPTKHGISFDTTVFDNSTLLKYLGIGASNLLLDVNEVLNYEGVHFELIHCFLRGSSEKIGNFISKYGLDSENYTVLGKHDGYAVIDLDLNENGIDELSSKLPILGPKSFINVSLGENLFKNIAILRAIRILMANLNKSRNIEYILSVSLNSVEQSDHKEDRIIEYTYKNMSAFMGGADYIFQEIGSSDFDRTAFHLFNLMDLESKMNVVQDPMCGSEFMEYLTDQYVKKVWETM